MSADERNLGGNGDDILPGRACQNSAKLCLAATDRPSEILLNRIAQHIIHDHLWTIGLELGINKAQLSCIKANFPFDANIQRFEVLCLWENKTVDATTGRLVEMLVEWCKKEYVVPEVWKSIKDLVSFELPANIGLETPCDTTVAEEPLIIPNAERLLQLQELTKQSLREKPFSTAKGKIWTETPSSIPLEKIFTKLSWVKKTQETYGIKTEELADITQLLSEQQSEANCPVRILVQAPGGMGKSTALKHLAMCWAEGSVDGLKQFDFIFHIALKDVHNNESLEKVIVQQHKSLSGNNIQPAEIKRILEGEGKRKILLLFDGHDEYKTGINVQIDKAITKDSVRNCWIILTSRETKELPAIREYMDKEAKITGFDEDGIKEYATNYLGSCEKCEELLQNVRGALGPDVVNRRFSTEYEILCKPFLLHMVCVLFSRKASLPKTKTGIFDAIVDRCIDWDAIRKSGKKSVKDMRDAIIKLGKMVMSGLQRDQPQQEFSKDEILKAAGPEAFELGLLMGIESDPLEEEQTQIFCFDHLMFLEFLAAKYVATVDKATLKLLFSSWSSIQRHREVIQFACGLADDPEPLLNFLCEQLLHNIKIERRRMSESSSGLHHDDLYTTVSFQGQLSVESVLMEQFWTQVSKPVSVKPMNNKYFNYVTTKTKTIFVPSKYYLLENVGDFEALTYEVDASTEQNYAKALPAECVVYIQNTDMVNTLKVLQRLGSYQQVSITWVGMTNVDVYTCKTAYDALKLDAFKLSRKAKVFQMIKCCLSTSLYLHVIQNVHDCDNLSWLNLRGTKGVPVELGAALRTMTGLRQLDLSGCCMTTDVSSAVMSGLSCCNNLEALDVSDNVLTDCIANVISDTTSACLPALHFLALSNTKLSKVDLNNLAILARSSPLNFLDVSKNELKDCLELLCESNYPELHYLKVAKSKLSKADVVSLSRAVKQGRLPKLINLNLLENTLTNCIAELFGDDNHPGFRILESILLRNTGLSRHDVTSFINAAVAGKLPRLCELDLSENDLTDCLGDLLCGPDFLTIYVLRVDNTKLSRADIVHITDAVSSGRLPQLMELAMRSNNLCTAEDALEDLVEGVCNKYKENTIVIELGNNNLSETFLSVKLSERVKQGNNGSLHINPHNILYCSGQFSITVNLLEPDANCTRVLLID